MATQPDGTRVLFTNIDPDAGRRAEFWRLVEKHERDPGPDKMSFRVNDNPLFWDRVRHREDCPQVLADAIDRADPDKRVSLTSGDNVEMRRWLSGVDGWVAAPKRRIGETMDDYNIRRSRSGELAKFADGRGGRIQYRVVGELPYELPVTERASILREFSAEFEKRKLPYVAVMHAPDHTNNDKNWHFHLIYYDRPAERLTRERLDAHSSETGVVNPAIHGDHLIGQWDFTVVEEKRDKWRNKWTDTPHAQPKYEEIAQDNKWIERLRKRLAEITNNHLERHDVVRRVDPRRHQEMGIHSDPQEHLGTRLANLEAMGIATPRGVQNEERQWAASMQKLDEALARKQGVVDRQADRWEKQLDRATMSVETKERTRADIVRWHQHASEAEEHGAIAKNIGEHMERMLSRAEKVKDTCERNLDAIQKGKASKYQASRRTQLGDRLDEAMDYLKAAAKFLEKEERLVADCRQQEATERKAAETLAKLIEERLAADRGRERVPVAEREAATGTRGRAAANTNSAPARQAEDDQRRALGKAAMDAWIETVRNERRRIVRKGRVLVPANQRPEDAEIISAINYQAMQGRLNGIKAAQDKIISEVVDQIGRNPMVVKRRADGADGPEFTMVTPRPAWAQAFVDYADDPAIVKARETALAESARIADRQRGYEASDAAAAATAAAEKADAEIRAREESERASRKAAANDREIANDIETKRENEVAEGAARAQAERRTVRQMSDFIVDAVRGRNHRVHVIEGVARLAERAMDQIGVDAGQVAEPGLQKRLVAIAGTQDREMRRLSAYAQAHPERIVESARMLTISARGPKDIVSIADRWKGEEEVQAALTATRDAHLARQAEVRRASQQERPAATVPVRPVEPAKPEVATPVEPKAPVAEPPRVTTFAPVDELREEAMRAARERDERARAAREAEQRREDARRQAFEAAGERAANRRPSRMSDEDVERIAQAARGTRTRSPVSIDPSIEMWAKAVQDGASVEVRQRIAQQVMSDRRSRDALAKVDNGIARRIRDEADQAQRGRQLGLGLDQDGGKDLDRGPER